MTTDHQLPGKLKVAGGFPHAERLRHPSSRTPRGIITLFPISVIYIRAQGKTSLVFFL